MRFHVHLDPQTLPQPSVDIVLPNIVLRGTNRGDCQNPAKGTEAYEILEAAWSVAWPRFCGRLKRLHRQSSALCFVDPGEPAQPFHCDADGDKQYHTIMVPLTTELDSGGTEFEDGVCYNAVRGLAYCFDGAIVHRGCAHRGAQKRICAARVSSHLVQRQISTYLRENNKRL